MRSGFYRLYRIYVNDDGRMQRRLVGRFTLYGDTLTSLEDHDGLVESLAPDGHVTDQTYSRLNSMKNSPYWSLVHENDIQSGDNSELLPEVEAV